MCTSGIALRFGDVIMPSPAQPYKTTVCLTTYQPRPSPSPDGLCLCCYLRHGRSSAFLKHACLFAASANMGALKSSDY